jgi:hypothetical protein
MFDPRFTAEAKFLTATLVKLHTYKRRLPRVHLGRCERGICGSD